MTNTTLCIVGNLTADPELRFTPNGAAVANFTVASTPRTFDKQTNDWKDGETLFMRCSIWREAAENVSESLARGMRVVVTGRLVARSWTTDQGENRTVMEMQVEEVGPSLRYATAQITKVDRRATPSTTAHAATQQRQTPPAAAHRPAQQQTQAPQPAAQQRPSWDAPTFTEEPPF